MIITKATLRILHKIMIFPKNNSCNNDIHIKVYIEFKQVTN